MILKKIVVFSVKKEDQQENVLSSFRFVQLISSIFGIPPAQLYKSKYYRFYLIVLFILLVECTLNLCETYIWQFFSLKLGFFNYSVMLTRRLIIIYGRIKNLRDHDSNNRIFLNLHEADKLLASMGCAVLHKKDKYYISFTLLSTVGCFLYFVYWFPSKSLYANTNNSRLNYQVFITAIQINGSTNCMRFYFFSLVFLIYQRLKIINKCLLNLKPFNKKLSTCILSIIPPVENNSLPTISLHVHLEYIRSCHSSLIDAYNCTMSYLSTIVMFTILQYPFDILSLIYNCGLNNCNTLELIAMNSFHVVFISLGISVCVLLECEFKKTQSIINVLLHDYSLKHLKSSLKYLYLECIHKTTKVSCNFLNYDQSLLVLVFDSTGFFILTMVPAIVQFAK